MRPELIIFDCDGVLIDSEGVASRVVAANLSRIGWAMDADAAMRMFMGMSIVEMQPLIEGRLRRALPDGWRDGLAAELADALSREAGGGAGGSRGAGACHGDGDSLAGGFKFVGSGDGDQIWADRVG